MMRGRAKLEAVWFTHRTLWSVLQDLRQALDREPESVRSLGLAILLLAHNCFEAYLNYATEMLFADSPCEQAIARYRGVMGKFNRIVDEISLAVDRCGRPYRTVRELKAWRDGVVHPKIERQERVVPHEDPKYLKNLETEFFRLVTLKFIDRAIEDVEALCDVVEAEAHRRHPVKFLGPGAFKGILGEGGGHLLN